MSKARAKGGYDPQTNEWVALFNPRIHAWNEHFEWVSNGTIQQGLTPVGRATIERLKINQDRVVDARVLWVFSGVHPPK